MQSQQYPSRLRAALVMVSLAALAACGGGGGDGGGTATAPAQTTGPSGAASGSSGAPSAASLRGQDFAVNGSTAGDQYGSHVAQLADGGWVVVWSSSPAGDGLAEVRLQRFDAQAQPAGGELLVAPRGSNAQVVTLAGGRFLVTWRIAPYIYTVASHGQLFDASGARIGSTLDLGSGFNNFSGQPTALPDGGFLFVADVNAGRYAQTYTAVRRFAADGSLQSGGADLRSTLMAADTAYDMNAAFRGRAAVLADGRIAVLWTAVGTTGNELRLSLFDSQANPVGGHVVLASGPGLEGAGIAALPGGGFAAAWEAGLPRQARSAVLGLFDASGQAVGQRTVAASPSADAVAPLLTTLGDGSLLVSWRVVHYLPDTTTRELFAQRFDVSGTPLDGAQALPSMTTPGFAAGGTHAVAPAGGSAYIAVYDRWSAAQGSDVRATIR